MARRARDALKPVDHKEFALAAAFPLLLIGLWVGGGLVGELLQWLFTNFK